MTKKEKQQVTVNENSTYGFYHGRFNAADVDRAIERFIELNPLFNKEEVSLEIRYSHGYYDSVDIEVYFNATREETDEEFTLRLEKEAAKKIKEAENAKKSKAAAKLREEAKDKEEFARLMKKFKGEEIDPSTI